MTRRVGWIAFVFSAAIAILFSGSAPSEARKPNILVIVGDDMGYADIVAHGCRDIPTPNLDALAAAGVRCTNGYVSGPYCSPTRAGLLTGRYQTRFGHETNPGDGNAGRKKQARAKRKVRLTAADKSSSERVKPGLPLTETTIANRLKAAGYATGLVGKWHLGGDPEFHPQRRGFDEFFGFLGGSHGYFPNARPPMLRGEETIEEEEYLTDAFGREAVAFIDRHADKSFFLYLAFNAVHTPMNATDDRLAKFKDIKDEQRRTYAAMMFAMDETIGKVLNKLRDSGLEQDTLVFFISDNGGPTMPGTALNGSRNDPLRGSKRTTLEGGVRVPFFVKWPGHVPAGNVYDKPVIQLDILPTALTAADVPIAADAKLDGVNLLPYLNGKESGKPHDTLYWRFGQQMAIRHGDWKLVRYDPVVDGAKDRTVKATEARLYNLAKDIGEKNNLIDSEPAKAKELQAMWDEWNELNIPPLWGDGITIDPTKPTAGKRKASRKAKETSSAGQ